MVAVKALTVNEIAAHGVILSNNDPELLKLRYTAQARTISAMHGHPHDHSHGHGHDHGFAQEHNRAHNHSYPLMSPSVLAWAIAATLGLVIAEVFGGLLGRSVALLNDAVHNLSDVPALGICWLATRWAQKPADLEKTYGYHRAGTLAAFTNSVLLVILALWLGYEAIERLRAPVQVIEGWMIWTSVAALAVNGGITLALVRGRADLNLRAILVHNFGDALSNVAIILAAFVIRYLHATWIDPLLGLGIGLLVLYSSLGILRESTHILLEGRPRETGVEQVARALLTIEHVQEVHDVHIWSLGGNHNALSCHARIPDMHMDECERVLAAIHKRLAEDFGIEHVTVQLERAGLPATSGYVMPAPVRKT